MHPQSEVAGTLQADPQGLGTGRTIIGFTTQMAAEAGQSSRAWPATAAGSPAGPAANGDIDRLPFSRVQDGIAGQPGGPPQQGQGLNPPGDDQYTARPVPVAPGCSVARLPPATGFEDSEKTGSMRSPVETTRCRGVGFHTQSRGPSISSHNRRNSSVGSSRPKHRRLSSFSLLLSPSTKPLACRPSKSLRILPPMVQGVEEFVKTIQAGRLDLLGPALESGLGGGPIRAMLEDRRQQGAQYIGAGQRGRQLEQPTSWPLIGIERPPFPAEQGCNSAVEPLIGVRSALSRRRSVWRNASTASR